MASLFSTIIAAALVNNLALVQLLGVSSFFSFSRRFSATVELAVLSFLVLLIAGSLNLLIDQFLLQIPGLQTLSLLSFVGVSAATTAVISHQLASHFPLIARRQSRAVLLMSSNSAVIGLAFVQSGSLMDLSEKFIYNFGAACGFAFSLLAFAALRQRIDQGHGPAALQGTPLYLISAGIASMAILGFAGLV